MPRKNLPVEGHQEMSSLDKKTAPNVKKRKLQRACDFCRSKKVKCDGPKVSNNRCSNCTARSAECTYVLEYNSGHPRSYVETLESRLKRMEQLVGKLYPATEMSSGLGDKRQSNDLPLSIPPAHERSHANAPPVGFPVTPLTVLPSTPLHAAEDAVKLGNELATDMRKLSMQQQPFRYHGKSSGLGVIQSAMALKNEFAGSLPIPQSCTHHPGLEAFIEDDIPVFQESSFPPPDLLDVLVDLYFRHISCHYPFLHEPMVKSSIQAGQHLHHGPFGAMVLLVCALGSRFTRDPRVLPDGSDRAHSAGWKWFALVDGARRPSLAPARLHNLQVYALMALFLYGSTAPQASWTVIGAGLRAAIDVGVHRRKMYTAATPTVEEELWRRVFWTLVHLEWMTGYMLGRPCSIRDEDLDLALPTECDDEYWVTPDGEPLFKQPPGKPSKVTAFVCMIRQGWILAFVTRTIYSTPKSKAQRDQSDQEWEKRVVAQLDSGLNKWLDSLPSHLRWDPEQENAVFLTQAATLNAFYHVYHIAVHQTFLTPSHPEDRESDLSLPSAIICTNAARSCIQVLEVLYNRTGSPDHRSVGMLFLSGMFLVTNMFRLKHSDGATNVGKDLELARKALEMLRSLHYEAQVSDLLAESLSDMMSAINRRLPAGARPSEAARGTFMEKAGGPRPSIPLLPLRREDMRVLESNWQPTPGDVNGNASAGSSGSLAPFTSTQPGSMAHVPPILDLPQHNSSLFALPFASGGGEPHAQGFTAPFGGLTQHVSEDYVPPPSVLPPEHNFLPRYGLSHSQPHSNLSADTNRGLRGQSQFDMAGRDTTFNLEEVLWSSGSPSPSSSAYPQAGTNDYGQPHSRCHLAGMAVVTGGGHAETGVMHTFGPVEPDVPMMWHNVNFSPIAERANWGVDDAGTDDY